ncbi:MBL fold metallo-hydrolase [Paenibacillus sp. GCM10027626]|uniref:MBL fold metallo-hydrolase n=1 Tax=Paenibacillus sp. GCM10027626 TaxID=3273411 RepID=UPI00362B40FE
MRVAEQIEILEISTVMMGKTETIYPALLWDGDCAVLVDTGYPGQLPLIREAIRAAGVPFEQLQAVIVTHQDLDHIGNLPGLLQEAKQPLRIMCSAVEQPYIQGDKRLVKLTAESIERAVAALPPETPDQWRNAFRATLEQPPAAKVDQIIAGGEVLPYAGGITVIDTPGHTPGHISLYHERSRTLIAGDALIVADGQLYGSNPNFTVDPAMARQSLQTLAQYPIDNVICYHGGLYRGQATERIAELSQSH